MTARTQPTARSMWRAGLWQLVADERRRGGTLPPGQPERRRARARQQLLATLLEDGPD